MKDEGRNTKRTLQAAKIDSVITKVFRGLERKTKAPGEIWQEWKKAIGEEKAAHTTLLKWDKGALVIGVEHPTWLYEIKRSCAHIVEKMNAGMGAEKVKDIKFRILEG